MVTAAVWRVSLDLFEGPLDLLLTLIRRESLDISVVSLARVTEQYLKHLALLETRSPDEMADFCEIAATLMAIKSRALLPRQRVADEDEDADAAELLERLRAYRRYRRVAQRLGERERMGASAFPRETSPVVSRPDPTSRPDDEVGADELAAAFRRALAEAERLSKVPPGPPVRPHPVRLRQRFRAIRDLLLERGSMTFQELVLHGRPEGARPREFVIVSFLALLEMLRRWAVLVRQEELFGEIVVDALPALARVPLPGEQMRWDDDPAEVERRS